MSDDTKHTYAVLCGVPMTPEEIAEAEAHIRAAEAYANERKRHERHSMALGCVGVILVAGMTYAALRWLTDVNSTNQWHWLALAALAGLVLVAAAGRDRA